MSIRFSFAALLIGSALACEPAKSALITFDNVADGAAIDTVYSALGVVFDNPIGGSIYARFTSAADSAPNVVSVFQVGFPAFDARWGAVEAVFTTAQSSVSIDAAIARLPEGLGAPRNAPRLEVYDTQGQLITVVAWNFALIPQPPVGAITGYQTLSYTAATDVIGKVRILSGQPNGSPSNFGLFDNLAFSQVGSVPDPNPVPEPTSLALLGIGIVGLTAAWCRRKRHWPTAAA